MAKEKEAHYRLNYSEYEIFKAASMEGFAVIKNGDECDLVNNEVQRFFFADKSLSFDEILAHSKPNETKSVFKFGDIELFDEAIYDLKIVIEGYNEGLDSVKFELDDLNLLEPYRYAISNKSFEMSLKLDEKPEVVRWFLSDFKYSFGKNLSRTPFIKIYINDSLIYEKICG